MVRVSARGLKANADWYGNKERAAGEGEATGLVVDGKECNSV